MNSSGNSTHLPYPSGLEVGASFYTNKNSRVPFTLLVLIAAFFIIAPLSISTVPFVFAMKYARYGILALVGLVTIQSFPRLGKLSKSWVLLGAVYALSSLWSQSTVNAIGYKSMFVSMILGGICVGNTATNLSGVMALAKSVTSAGLILYVSTALAIQEGIAEPILWFNDRMSVLGLNSNFVGIFSSSYFVSAVALSFFSQERKWKLIGFTTSILFSTGVIYSGSRLALLMSCTATFLFFLTKHERYRKTSLYVSALLILVVSVALLLSPQAGASPSGVVYEASSEGGSGFRALDELTRDTRSSHWKRAISLWMENPIFGVGWSEYRGRWTLHHSAYLQVLVESGILGAVVWAWVLWCCFTQCRYVYLNRRLLDDWEITTAELGMAVIGVCLIHAFGESALLAATMPLAVALGVATQLLDESASNIAQIRSAYHGLEHEASDEPRWDDTVADQVD